MPQDTESRSLDKVIVRLPDGMRDELKEMAAHNKRSMNAEIVARLEDYKALRLDDIKWLKSEMERLRKERDAAEARLRDGAKADFETVMITGLPAGLGLRIGAAAQRNKRQLTEEVVQALEAAFPPPSADDLIDLWESLLRPFFKFHEPEDPQAKKQQDNLIANIRTMIDFFKAERDAGRAGDLEARYKNFYKVGPDGVARRKAD